MTLARILAAERLLDGGNASSWLPSLVTQKITKGEIEGSDYAAALAHVFIPFIVIEPMAVFSFRRHDVNN